MNYENKGVEPGCCGSCACVNCQCDCGTNGCDCAERNCGCGCLDTGR